MGLNFVFVKQTNMSTKELQNIELPLAGVDSEHCALIVDKGLAKVSGVVDHKVESNSYHH